MKTLSPFQKFVACMLAGLACSNATWRIGRRFLSTWIPMPVIIAAAVIILITSLVLAVLWARHRRPGVDHPTVGTPALPWQSLNFWQAVLRYAVAVDLSMLGWQKIFRLQFGTPLGMLDMPFSSFSGESLTWSYFGHSYPMVFIIGAFQIGGSFLLVFSRTRLLGLFLLIPVMLTIVLINYCFHLALGENIYSTIIFIELVYLLLADYDRLMTFFFKTPATIPSISFRTKTLKLVLRASVIAIPLLLIAAYGRPDKHPDLTGKYSVTQFDVNGKNRAALSCQDSVLTVVYFDVDNDCVFEFNDQTRRLYGTYAYHEDTHSFDITWRYPIPIQAPFAGELLFAAAENQTRLSGKIGRDTVGMVLTKLK